MIYTFDTELIEDGSTIDLISIGITSTIERSFYRLNSECNFAKADPWIKANVLAPMGFKFAGSEITLPEDQSLFRTKKELAYELLRYFRAIDPQFDPNKFYSYQELFDWSYSQPNLKPELWAWYGAYDHVTLCQIFGKMIDLPNDFPQYTNDLKTLERILDYPELPEQAAGKHNALTDAKWNLEVWYFMQNLINQRAITL